MRAAFLIRCSTKKQDYDRQVRDLRKVAHELSYEQPDEKIIYGEHITGRDDATKRDRLSIQRLKEGAEKKLFDVILISEASRMSRDPTSGMWYVRQFTNMGIPVYFKDLNLWTIDPQTNIKNSNAESILIGAFTAAAKYLTSMKTQIASGRRNWLADNQLVIGHVPFGYKKLGGKDKSTKNTIVVDEEKAEIVNDIFNSYLKEGATLKSVALDITKRYNQRFTVAGIHHVLTKEEYYKGELSITTTDPDTKEKEVFIIRFEPIIEKALYEQATLKRTGNRNSQSPYPSQKTHLLSKLIKCPICGHSFTPRKRSGDGLQPYRMYNGKVSYSWKCMSKINNAGNCNSKLNISNEKLSTIVWELIKKEIIFAVDLSDDNKERKIKEEEDKIVNYKRDIENYENQILNMDKRIDRAYRISMNAPEEMQARAEADYYQTLQKCFKEKKECEEGISNLRKSIENSESLLTYYRKPIDPQNVVESIEGNFDAMRKIFTDVIIKINPYYVSPGVIVCEVFTIIGVFNILLNAHMKKAKRIAYYVSGDIAYWQESNRKFVNAPQGHFFYIPKPILLTLKDGEPITMSFSELSEYCSLNGWEIVYHAQVTDPRYL